MTDKARLRFFDIEKCGYYERGVSNSAPLFSGITDTLTRLCRWANDQTTLEDTKTFEADPDRDIRRSFFVDSYHDDNGDVFLAMWNELSNDDGKVFGMSGSQEPGSTNMLERDFDDETAIPGMISYFWFIPSLGKFSSIKFSHSDHGKSQLDNYFKNYLLFKSDYMVSNADSDSEGYGYSETGGFSTGCNNVLPQFVAKSTKNESVRQKLITNISRINHIIKEQTYDVSIPDDRTFVEKLMDPILGGLPLETRGVKDVKIRLSYSPSIDEIDEIIANYEDRDASLKRVGFKISGENSPVYLDGINVIFDYDFNITRPDNNSIPIAVLAHAVSVHRVALLRGINPEN